jgi:hypothetical protein
VDQAWSEFDPTWQPLVEGAFEDDGDREACSHHPHPMSIELRLRGHLRATGVVDSPAGPNCTRGAPVVIQRRKTAAQPWRNALSVNADDFGTFETKLQDRPGRYRALIRWEGSAGPCAGARSGVIRHRHRR